MELLQHAPRRANDSEERVPQPGEPGWFHRSLSSVVQSSSSSESGESGLLPPPLAALLRSSSSSESGESGLLPPPLVALLRSSSSSESGDTELSFDHRCLINLAISRLPAPPPPAPARKVNPYTKERRIFRATPQVILERSKTFARGALEHYNRRKKIKFELMDVWPIVMMPESRRFYTHINFTARCSKEGSQEMLFFAELYNCGKRRVSSGFLVTCCEPLGSDRTVGHKDFQLDNSAVRKNHNFNYCFACTPRMFHPKGEKYVAGHCNLPHFYDSPY